jgi:hypothetical protein
MNVFWRHKNTKSVLPVHPPIIFTVLADLFEKKNKCTFFFACFYENSSYNSTYCFESQIRYFVLAFRLSEWLIFFCVKKAKIDTGKFRLNIHVMCGFWNNFRSTGGLRNNLNSWSEIRRSTKKLANQLKLSGSRQASLQPFPTLISFHFGCFSNKERVNAKKKSSFVLARWFPPYIWKYKKAFSIVTYKKTQSRCTAREQLSEISKGGGTMHASLFYWQLRWSKAISARNRPIAS